jgi:hypothetical protein
MGKDEKMEIGKEKGSQICTKEQLVQNSGLNLLK